MNYCLLKNQNDPDIPLILSVYRLPSVSQFISISEENYLQYVTSSENIWFYKIFEHHNLVATIHLELSDYTLYMSVVVFPAYQKTGIGTTILSDIQSGKIDIAFNKIQVSIDKRNIASISLFTGAGFLPVAEDGELIEFEYIRPNSQPKGHLYE